MTQWTMNTWDEDLPNAAASTRSHGLLVRAQQKARMRTRKAAAMPIASEGTRKVSGGRHSLKQEMLAQRRTAPGSWSHLTKTTEGPCSTEPCLATGQRRSSSAPPERRTDAAPAEAREEGKGRPTRPALGCLGLVLMLP